MKKIILSLIVLASSSLMAEEVNLDDLINAKSVEINTKIDGQYILAITSSENRSFSVNGNGVLRRGLLQDRANEVCEYFDLGEATVTKVYYSKVDIELYELKHGSFMSGYHKIFKLPNSVPFYTGFFKMIKCLKNDDGDTKREGY